MANNATAELDSTDELSGTEEPSTVSSEAVSAGTSAVPPQAAMRVPSNDVTVMDDPPEPIK